MKYVLICMSLVYYGPGNTDVKATLEVEYPTRQECEYVRDRNSYLDEKYAREGLVSRRNPLTWICIPEAK